MITVKRVPADRWKDFTDWLDDMYMEPKDITANHVFVMGKSATPTSYECRIYRDADPVTKDLKPTRRSKRKSKGLTGEERAAKIKNMYNELDTIPPPGLRPIKKNELHNKIRPIAPPEHQSFYDQFKPTEEEARKLQNRNSAKNAAQAAKKKARKAKQKGQAVEAPVAEPVMEVDNDADSAASDDDMVNNEIAAV